MISRMENGCPSCGRAVKAPWRLAVQPMRLYRRWRTDGARSASEYWLCEPCSEWLGGLVASARGGAGQGAVLGSPSARGRRLVFDDQCQVCCEVPSGRAATIAWVSPAGRRLAVFACAGCEAWIVSLATDGRTVRGEAGREIDGAYGLWPHPNFRGFSVRVLVEDAAARNLVIETCSQMGMTPTTGPADVTVVEATPRGSAVHALRTGAGGRRGTVVLAGLGARRDLAAALDAGGDSWLTVPVTPQQVTAGLAAALNPNRLRAWDPATCLPIADGAALERPAVVFTPAAGADPFEVGWLLRRFARGYDGVEWLDGEVLVTPKVPASGLARVAARLRLLLEGRATMRVVSTGEVPARRRFEAAG